MPHQPALRTVSIGNTTFTVEVVNTPAAEERGLGGRTSIPLGSGMLFAFDKPGSWGIWMKDMNFPIDIIWAHADGTITTIARDVATSTYPQTFYPATPDAAYVLEVNAGAAAHVSTGDRLVQH